MKSSGTYTLRLALATANVAQLEVWRLGTIQILIMEILQYSSHPVTLPNNAHVLYIQVRVNAAEDSPAMFSTGVIGHDNAIARHGIHGLYRLFSVQVPGNLLVAGDNSVFLSQTMATGPLQGIMYDYIRLEGPSPPPAKMKN